MSTNKVYGDAPNELRAGRAGDALGLRRPALPRRHRRESCRIDASLHSLFGASKVAADVMVQEYGRYFGMPTVCFRGGCLTGPNHSGAELHGFLAYLAQGDATRGAPTGSSATRASRCATTSTASTSARPSRRSSRAPAPARSTTSAAGAPTASRCSRRSSASGELLGGKPDGGPRRRRAPRRPHLLHQRPRAAAGRLSGLGDHARSLETILAELASGLSARTAGAAGPS